MNKLFLIGLVTVLVSCGAQKIVPYEYVVNTRGYNFSIVVNKKNIQESSDISISKNEFSEDTFITDADLWKALQKGSKTIKLSEINKLESPTNRRQFDGAMFANLIVLTKDSTYKSASFDHGQPPLMLKTVVDSLVKLMMN
jgi:hypothetical protein